MSSPDGLLIIDKTAGPTSHDVVSRVRRLAGTRKVGHAGTLDPAATGVLVLGLGPSTRLLTYLVGSDKEYLATIRLGASTVTDDAEGHAVATADPAVLAAVDRAAIAAAVARLTGDIEQVPSAVSAIKVAGRRSYARVRAGEQVDLPARPVTVSDFVVGDIRRPVSAIDIDVRVVCSSGTYVRALARDLGAGLGVGGHLTALRRTRVGPFAAEGATRLDDVDVDNVDNVDDVDEADVGPVAGQGLVDRLIRPADAARRLFPVLALDARRADDLRHGRRVEVGDDVGEDTAIAALDPDGRLVGLARREGSRLRVLANFPEAPR